MDPTVANKSFGYTREWLLNLTSQDTACLTCCLSYDSIHTCLFFCDITTHTNSSSQQWHIHTGNKNIASLFNQSLALAEDKGDTTIHRPAVHGVISRINNQKFSSPTSRIPDLCTYM